MRRTVRWPLVSLPLPSRRGQMVAFDLLEPLINLKRSVVTLTFYCCLIYLVDMQKGMLLLKRRKQQEEGVRLRLYMVIYQDGDVFIPFYQTEVHIFLFLFLFLFLFISYFSLPMYFCC